MSITRTTDAPLPHEDDEYWQGADDPDGMPCRWMNNYWCAHCGEAWTNAWSSARNHTCPVCDRVTAPESSYWLDIEGHLTTTVVNHDDDDL